MEKICNICNVKKDSSEFYREAQMPDGKRKQCKECKNKITEIWRKTNREKYNADMRAYNSKNYQKLRLYRYKLSKDQYDTMLSAQKNKCLLCKRQPEHILCVDHNHQTGKVRGLLCRGCNRAIAILENPTLYERAKEYLKAIPSEELPVTEAESDKADSPCSADLVRPQKPFWGPVDPIEFEKRRKIKSPENSQESSLNPTADQ